MQEPVKEGETLKEARTSGHLESIGMGDKWITTDRIPLLAETNTLSYWNWLIDNELCTFLVYINGAGSRKVVRFIVMNDKYYIGVVYKDSVLNKQEETYVTHHTNFFIHLNSEKWFL